MNLGESSQEGIFSRITLELDTHLDHEVNFVLNMCIDASKTTLTQPGLLIFKTP